MKNLLILFILAGSACFGQAGNSLEAHGLPRINARINDFGNILSMEEETVLLESITDFYQKEKISIVLVSVNSIDPFETIFDYSLALANKSSIGEIFIVVYAEKRLIQIQNRDDTDKLTNAESARILEQFILAEFKKGNYFEGLAGGINEIKKEF